MSENLQFFVIAFAAWNAVVIFYAACKVVRWWWRQVTA